MRNMFFIPIIVIFNMYSTNSDAAYTITSTSSQVCDILSTHLYAFFEPTQYSCTDGTYLPANINRCISCPANSVCTGGTFTFNTNVFQGLYLQNITTTTIYNGCADNFPSNIHATYTINQHTCDAGYYMPANYDGCVICPAGSYCVGGTYTFNETIDQGIVACPTGYSSSAGASTCTPNTITINWDGAESGTCTYGGTITTPTTPPSRRGYTFVGWTFQ